MFITPWNERIILKETSFLKQFFNIKKERQLRFAVTALFSGSGSRTRTYDLRVMSPTSYQLLHPALCLFYNS